MAMETKTGPAGTVDGVAGSDIVRALEAVWGRIQERHPELPSLVIITGSALVGPPRWGHFRAGAWQERSDQEAAVSTSHSELFIAGESLARGAESTVETMLHEAAHALAQVRGIKDTSRQGRWHNREFRRLAEELGLAYKGEAAHQTLGFSEVSLTDETREAYAEVITELDGAIRAHLTLPPGMGEGKGSGEQVPGGHGRRGGGGAGNGGEKRSTNNVKAVCGCESPRIIRVSRAVLDGAPITCGECEQPFAPQDVDSETEGP